MSVFQLTKFPWKKKKPKTTFNYYWEKTAIFPIFILFHFLKFICFFFNLFLQITVQVQNYFICFPFKMAPLQPQNLFSCTTPESHFFFKSHILKSSSIFLEYSIWQSSLFYTQLFYSLFCICLVLLHFFMNLVMFFDSLFSFSGHCFQKVTWHALSRQTLLSSAFFYRNEVEEKRELVWG